MKSFLRDVLITVAMAVVIFFLMNLVIVVPPSEVISGSMKPSLIVGQRVIIDKVEYYFHGPRRGDVITFHPPRNVAISGNGDYVKRVIGMPGETVEIKNGTVNIRKSNGEILQFPEKYIAEPMRDTYQGRPIPPDEYFVMGDNRNGSGDSRLGWTVPRQNIIGKAWLTIWPPNRWGLAPNYPLPQ